MIMVVCVLLTSCSDNISTVKVERYRGLISDAEWTYVESDDVPLNDFVSSGEWYQYYDGCLYFFNGNTDAFMNANTTLMRLNLKTGNMTTVCSDPLCTHKTQTCPFAGMISCLYIDGANLVYIRQMYIDKGNQEGNHIRQFCSYNLETMKLTVYKQEDVLSGITYGQLLKILCYDGYYYYQDYVYNPDNEEYKWMIQKVNIETGEVVTLIDETDDDAIQDGFLFILDGRIYFRNAESIFSTDTELKDKQVHIEGRFPSSSILTDGKYIFYAVTEADGHSEKIYRMDLDGSNLIDLGICATSSWFLTTNYIYWSNPDYFEINYANKSGSSQFFSDAMYRCDHDGNNVETVYISEQKKDENSNRYMQIMRSFAVGNYLFASYSVVNDENGNNLIDDGEEYSSWDTYLGFNIMRVDIANQTYDLIYPNKDREQ